MASDPPSRVNEPDDRISRTALEDYARRFGPSLRRYFSRRGAQAQDIDDLLQDVFVRLASRAEGDNIENPEAYLMQTASSAWNDYLRKRGRVGHARQVEYIDELHSPEVFSPDRVLESRQSVELLVEALRQLPGRTMHIYVLCRLDGMKREEVARRLGISVSAIDKHLIVATKHVKTALGKILDYNA